jgi:hypothetical protein
MEALLLQNPMWDLQHMHLAGSFFYLPLHVTTIQQHILRHVHLQHHLLQHLLIRKQGIQHKNPESNRTANAGTLSFSFCFWLSELASLLRAALD